MVLTLLMYYINMGFRVSYGYYGATIVILVSPHIELLTCPRADFAMHLVLVC